MNAPKFTPGPWSHRNGRIFQTDRENLTIANVARAYDGDYSPMNGDLLAAAPELYKALERMLSFYDDCGYSQTMEIAKAALAKARGEING